MTSPVADAAWRRSNLGHLLFVATGRCVAEVLRVVHAAGFPEVTESQLALYGHLPRHGARLTALAAGVGVTKQSAIELVDRAARAGLVRRQPDPTDARAKIVFPTAEGERLVHAVRFGSAAATRLADTALGAAARDALRRDLSAYTGRVGAMDQQLGSAARRFVGDVLAAVHPHGHVEVTEALLSLFRHLDFDGSRLTELAARARITKQSMGGLVERAEALGLVERVDDDADRRARTIRFTQAGHAMLALFRTGIETAEARFLEVTAADLPRLKISLTRLIEADHAAAAPMVASGASGASGASDTPNSPG